MKFASTLAFVLAGLASAKKCKPHDAPSKFTLLHTNDVHAHLDQFNKYGTDCTADNIAKNQCYGGVSRIKTVVDQYRATTKDLLVFDAGDQFQGTLFFNLYGGEAPAEAMNAIGYDVMTIGNHEFDRGLDELTKFFDKTHFDVVSSNIGVKGSALEKYVQPYVVIDKYQVGIIGYITSTTPSIVGADAIKGLTFTDPVAPVQRAVDELKAKGINRIICVSHNGYGQDQELASKTNGIDLIVGGHSHTLLANDPTLGPSGPYPTAVKNLDGKTTFIVQAYRFGHYLGHLDLEFDKEGEITSILGQPILLDQKITPEPTLQGKVAKWAEGFKVFETDITTNATAPFPAACGSGECAIGSLISSCMISEQKLKGLTADIAFVNSGGIRAGIEAGPVSVKTIMTILPFGNALVNTKWTGAKVKEIIEGVIAKKRPDGAVIITPPQWAGIEYTVDTTKPEFQKVVELKIGGKLYDPAAIYSVLTIDFISGGGDNIMPKEPGLPTLDGLAETFTSCLRKLPSITPTLINYVKTIP